MKSQKLSVVIPAYNEEKRLPATLDNILGYLKKQPYRWEIIVIDDGSTDKTFEIINTWKPDVQVLRHRVNMGKGAAVRSGLKKASGDYCLFMDADNSTTIDQIERCWPLIDENCDVVIGSRAVAGAEIAVAQPLWRRWLGRVGQFVITTLLLKGIPDSQAGFKIISKRAVADLLPQMTINGWGFDVELLMAARRRGWKIGQVPIRWVNDCQSKVTLASYLRTAIEILRLWLNGAGFWIALGGLTIFNALLRAVRLDFPAGRVFDEVYFPKFAWQFLQGGTYYDVQPFLAELPHTPSLLIFGDTPLGWRGAAWFYGAVFIFGIGLLGYLLTGKRLVGAAAAFLASFDSLIFVYGRTGLSDMFLLAVLVWALALFFLSCRVKQRWKAGVAAIASGVLLGSLPAIKFYGIAGLAVAVVWLIIQFRKKQLWPNISWKMALMAFLFVPVITYTFWLIPIVGIPGYLDSVMGEEIFRNAPASWPGRALYWHSLALGYHINLTQTHSYGSKWWQWPTGEKAILFYSNQQGGNQRVIWAAANKVLWWSGGLALLAAALALWRRFRPVDAWLIVGALAFWLPWAFVSRVLFLYHFLPALVFEILLLAVIIERLLRKSRLQPLVGLYLLAVVVWFVIQYPYLTGL